MTTTNVEDFSEKAKALLASLKESFSQVDFSDLDNSDQDEFSEPETIIVDVPSLDDEQLVDSPMEYEIIDDEPETFNVDGDIEEPMMNDGETIQTTVDTLSVPFEEAPKFRVYWRAWKEGNSTSGQTESNLETAQMARAEAMTKLYDLGFNDLEILAIETIKSEESAESQI